MKLRNPRSLPGLDAAVPAAGQQQPAAPAVRHHHVVDAVGVALLVHARLLPQLVGGLAQPV